jgi:hypothetical protein
MANDLDDECNRLQQAAVIAFREGLPRKTQPRSSLAALAEQ